MKEILEPMQKSLSLVAMIAATAAASGCSTINQAVGNERIAPDEFRVVTNAPLTLPPDYALRPPQPGEARPMQGGAAEEARQALFGQDLGTRASAGEQRLVANAGAETAPADIRQTVDFEGATIVHRTDQAVNRVVEYRGEGSAASTTEEQESVRRVTGGGTVVLPPEASGRVKLPGT
ncbi:MAG: DUF3035 domain-containing protein [Alphaproteobacteria bacterium]|nr:DUF3035 domain-containing protein [Alphaproteobacteria bacterium]